jgi:hypothetical protein
MALASERLAALGQQLRAAGLNARALAACFGLTSLAHLPRAADALPAPGLTPPPAALVPWLLVAGRPVLETAARKRLGDDLDALLELGVLARRGDQVVALMTLVPVGAGIAVVDPPTVTSGRDAVLFPDDSSFHLIGALPRRPVGRWLDVGTGAGVAVLAGPVAAEVRATDLNPRAIERARLGAQLSSRAADFQVADLLAGAGDRRWDLVTFNAPLPGGPAYRDEPMWRASDQDLRTRFLAEVVAVVADGGEVLMHALVDDALRDALAALPGEVVIARYTPASQRPAFAVLAWRPGGPAGLREVAVELGRDAPHVGRAALD